MNGKWHYLIIMLFLTDFITAQDSEDNNCTLINKLPQKPQPSLIQCYRSNRKACCNSAADDFIKDKYSALLSGSCFRKFPALEAYFCYGCSQSERLSTNMQLRTIRMCSSFIEALWGGDISKPTDRFDNCGMKLSSVDPSITSDSESVLPSQAWKNAQEFVTRILPPFYSDYTILIVDEDCFNHQIILGLSPMIYILLIFVLYTLFQ